MASKLEFLPPERLRPDHEVSGFVNGKHPILDTWLKERALVCEGLSARTYVICRKPHPLQVSGYYAISTALEERQTLPGAKMRKGMPNRVPLMLIGRLALDSAIQGQGLGAALLSDAIRRCCAVAEIAGVRAILAHAIDDDAVKFYQHYGFVRSPLGERAMLLPIETAKAALAD